MNQCNRGKGDNFRKKNGDPRDEAHKFKAFLVRFSFSKS